MLQLKRAGLFVAESATLSQADQTSMQSDATVSLIVFGSLVILVVF